MTNAERAKEHVLRLKGGRFTRQWPLEHLEHKDNACLTITRGRFRELVLDPALSKSLRLALKALPPGSLEYLYLDFCIDPKVTFIGKALSPFCTIAPATVRLLFSINTLRRLHNKKIGVSTPTPSTPFVAEWKQAPWKT